MRDHLSKGEIRKDALQGAVEATATTVGEVVTILSGAVRDVAGALGGLATDVFELREAARRASAEHDRPDLAVVDDGSGGPGSAAVDGTVRPVAAPGRVEVDPGA